MAEGVEAKVRACLERHKRFHFTPTQPWDFASNRRVVLDALAIFGIERAIFATNVPVAGLRIGYGALISAMSRMLSHLSPADRDRFFWKNAKAFYRL